MPIPVLFLITDLDLGGSPLMLRALVRGMREIGTFSPTVVSLAPPGPVGEMIQAEGTPVLTCGARSVRDLPRALPRWVKILQQTRPALVHSILIHANAVAMAGKRFYPNCLYLQGLHTVQERPRWHWWLQGLLAPMAEGILAPSQAVLDKIARFGPFQRGVAIPNGIDLPRFRDAVPLPIEDRPWPAGARVVGYVGRFDPVKRIDLLLHAAAWLLARNPLAWQDLHLALIGYGEQETALRQLTAGLGLASRVHFCGPTRTPERWYKCLDVLCLPSPAEGFGLAVVEAMAAGTPVVGFASTALHEVVSDGHEGVLFPRLEPESLALALTEVMANPAATAARKTAAQARAAACFGEREMALNYTLIFKKFLAATRP